MARPSRKKLAVPEEVVGIAPLTRQWIRLAVYSLHRADKKATNQSVRDFVRGAGLSADDHAIALLMRHVRSGVLDPTKPWGDESPSSAPEASGVGLELAQAIRDAQTDGDRERVLTELAARALEGMDPTSIQRAIDALKEARQAAEKRRQTEPPPPDPDRFLPVGADALRVARMVEEINPDGPRRGFVVQLVEREWNNDKAEG